MAWLAAGCDRLFRACLLLFLLCRMYLHEINIIVLAASLVLIVPI